MTTPQARPLDSVDPGLSAAFSTPGMPPQYRVALGLNLDGYMTPDIGDAYQIHLAHEGAALATPTTPGQFGILAPTAVPVPVPVPVVGTPTEGVFSEKLQGLEQDIERSNGQLSSKIVVDPPDLETWRAKLFDVDETIVLTHEEFETYFPHVDNVYSHRSTQRYKRKPFISHYWDCRMKGRPPGTPKSNDPNKKKRKRSVRQRDLCDVKIKITEYFPGAQLELDVNSGVDMNPAGQRLWTIQRVNGNGGNGKGDGVAGPHKHTLERSDEIKKNSVQRYLIKEENVKKDKEKAKRTTRKTTGAASITARKHAKENELELYGACFCPFSQRVWIALEAKGVSYQYCETDPFRHPAQLFSTNSRGCIPTIKHGDWICSESSVILEYLEDIGLGPPLLPIDSKQKANCRFWINHINRHIVPNFLTLIQNRDMAFKHEDVDRLQDNIDILARAADEEGPFFLGPDLSLVDIHLAPFALRLSRILTPTQVWSPPPPGSRWARWLDAIEGHRSVGATTSNQALYSDTVDMLLRHGGLQCH